MTAGFDGLTFRDLDEAIAHCRPVLEKMRGAHLFITGGTGFFGRWLLALLARAHGDYSIRVTALSRDPIRFATICPDLAGHPAIAFARGDVRYFEFPKGSFTHVIHAATDTSVAADADPTTLTDSIVSGTARVLEFAESADIRRLLYVSSGAVYGPQPKEIEHLPEDYRGAPDPLDPRSAYGQAKRLAEQLCACAAGRSRLQPVIARAFAFVGPGLPLDGHFAIGNFIADALNASEIVVSGDGTPLRSYLYAGDLAAWLLTLLVEGESGVAYNVGSDIALSIADVAARVSGCSPVPPVVAIRGAPMPDAPRARYVPSIARARALGLDVWTPLEQAIARTMEFERRRPQKGHAPGERNEHAQDERLTFVVDVDGVVASLTPGNDYTLAEPLGETISAVNALYEKGHRIVMFTARGSATGIDWRKTTEDQFARWGLRYHELHFGKPAADYYIDDRLMPVTALKAFARA